MRCRPRGIAAASAAPPDGSGAATRALSLASPARRERLGTRRRSRSICERSRASPRCRRAATSSRSSPRGGRSRSRGSSRRSSVHSTHWSVLTPAKRMVRVPRLRRIESSGVSQKPLMRCLSTRMSCGSIEQLVDHGGGPAVLLEDARAVPRQRLAEADALALRLVQVVLVRRHVGQVGSVAPVDPQHPAADSAPRRQQAPQRLDRRAVGAVVERRGGRPSRRRCRSRSACRSPSARCARGRASPAAACSPASAGAAAAPARHVDALGAGEPARLHRGAERVRGGAVGHAFWSGSSRRPRRARPGRRPRARCGRARAAPCRHRRCS